MSDLPWCSSSALEDPPTDEADMIMFKNWIRSLTPEQLYQLEQVIRPDQFQLLMLSRAEIDKMDQEVTNAMMKGIK